jgi:hypothetical protein
MKHVSRILPVVAAVAAAAVAADEIQVHQEPGVDFGRYRTFAWGAGTPAQDPDNEKRLHEMVEARLVARGLTLVDKEPDVFVVTHVFRGKKAGSRAVLAGYGYGDEGWDSGKWSLGKVPTGTVVVDLLDFQEKRMVWRGVASGTIDQPGDKSPERVGKALDQLFERLPLAVATPPPATAGDTAAPAP